MMDYNDCIQSAMIDPLTLGGFLLILILSVFIARRGKRGIAYTLFIIGSGLCVAWIYGYYELNCIELR